ncbi:hypothetical protein [Methylosinus sp. Sm6]
MAFAEHIGDLSAVGEDSPIGDGDEDFDRQVFGRSAGIVVLMF